MSFTTHVKGFDTFYTSVYETGEKFLKAALEEGGYDFTFLPNHLAMEEFPFKMEELKQYDLLVLSDIGANTLLLPGAALYQKRDDAQPLQPDPRLCAGGRRAFDGRRLYDLLRIDGKGKWQDTAVQEVLPVQVLSTDDRMEHCEESARLR